MSRSVVICCLFLAACSEPFLNDFPSIEPATAGTDTEPPTVRITQPADGVPVSGLFTWTAEVDDADSAIGSVEFRAGGALVQSLVNPPYSLTRDSTLYPDGS